MVILFMDVGKTRERYSLRGVELEPPFGPANVFEAFQTFRQRCQVGSWMYTNLVLRSLTRR